MKKKRKRRFLQYGNKIDCRRTAVVVVVVFVLSKVGFGFVVRSGSRKQGKRCITLNLIVEGGVTMLQNIKLI